MCFDFRINASPIHAVGSVMAQELHDASDHLPVCLDLLFPRVVSDVREKSLEIRLDLVGD